MAGSGLVPNLRIWLSVSRIELLRDLRWLRAQDYVLLGTVVVALLATPGLWFTYRLMIDVGESFVTGSPPLATATTLVVVGWMFTVCLFVADGAGSNGEIGNKSAILTMRPVRDIAPGLLFTEIVKMAPYVFVPIAVVYLGLSVGVGTVRPFLSGLALGVVLTVSSGLIGYPIGVTLLGGIRQYRHLKAIKPIIGVVLGITYFATIFTGGFTAVVDIVRPVSTSAPLGWLGALAFATVPGADVSSADAASAVAATVLLVPVGIVGTVFAARHTWYVEEIANGDGGTRDSTDELDGTDATVFARILGSLCRTREAYGIARVSLLRRYRSPASLSYGAFPLLGAIPLFEQLLTTGSVPWYTPWLVIGYGGWFAGLAFTANVLGNQGRTLPLLLTSRTSGLQVVWGSIVAATIVVAPVTSVLAVGSGVAANRPPTELLGVGFAAPAVVVASATLATGIGTTFPRVTTVDISSSKNLELPSKYTLWLFSMVVICGAYATAIVVDETARIVATGLLSTYALDVDPSTLELLSGITIVLLVAGIPVSCLRAARQFDTYRLS
ncbi:hypothetical protein [Natronorubrum texcoconense]|nr:hypothetical protein [Natronorubrum texcoconense]